MYSSSHVSSGRLLELKLLDTTVGVVVLSAGVANDLVGWTLLALSVALVNAASGLTALWILMICVGWALFVLFPIKWVVLWLAHRTGSIENGPTMFFMTVSQPTWHSVMNNGVHPDHHAHGVRLRVLHGHHWCVFRHTGGVQR